MSRRRSSSRRRGRALGLCGVRPARRAASAPGSPANGRREMLDEVDLVDVAARDRLAHALNRLGVVGGAPGLPPRAEREIVRSCRCHDRQRTPPVGRRRRRAAAGTAREGAGERLPTDRRREPVAEVQVRHEAPRRPGRRSHVLAAIASISLERPRPRGSRSRRGHRSRRRLLRTCARASSPHCLHRCSLGTTGATLPSV